MIAAAILAGGASALALLAGAPPSAPGAAYRVEAVSRGSIRSEIVATGVVQPETVTQVGTELSGQIAEVAAEVNARVKAGDLLARLDARSFEAGLREARAQLDVARAEQAMHEAAVAKAQALLAAARAGRTVLESEVASVEAQHREARGELERSRRLVERSVISSSELEQVQTGYASARAQAGAATARLAAQDAEIQAAAADVAMARARVANAEAVVRQREASLERAEVALRRTEIRAPVSGVVLRRDVEAGQTVAASLQAPTLFTLAGGLERMQVQTRVDQADIGRVRPGQGAWFTVDAYPGRRFTGRVALVHQAPETFQNVVTYTVVVAAENPGRALLPGMVAVVRVVVDHAVDVLMVPNAALRFAPAGGTPPRGGPGEGSTTLWVPGRLGRPQAAAVRLGPSDDCCTALIEGRLREGDAVIVGRRRGRDG